MENRPTIIKELIYEYFHLDKGTPIADFLKLIYICKIKGQTVYISRRALKHFVESRSSEMVDKHHESFILERLFFIIDNIEKVLNDYDAYKIESGKHYYLKNFSFVYMPAIRIVLEFAHTHYEIITMHYKKIKNTAE